MLKGYAIVQYVPITSISQLLQFIMQDLSWSETPLLEAVDKNETEMKELRNTLSDAVMASMTPLWAYARKFEQFLPVINLDIKQYIL